MDFIFADINLPELDRDLSPWSHHLRTSKNVNFQQEDDLDFEITIEEPMLSQPALPQPSLRQPNLPELPAPRVKSLWECAYGVAPQVEPAKLRFRRRDPSRVKTIRLPAPPVAA